MKKSCLTCKSYYPEKSSEGRYYCKIVDYTWNHDCGLKHDCMEGGYKPRKEEEMDRQTAIINHRHMWGWLSEHPEEEKIAYLVTYDITPIPRAQCFLCQYQVGCDGGKRCLLVWPPNRAGEQNCTNGGLWSQWEQETDVTRRAELARQIRDLPEREEKVMQGSHVFLSMDPAPTATRIRMRQEAGRTWMDTVTDPETPPPPPKLTRAEAIAKTREQWRWYANNPTMDKEAYFINKGIPQHQLPYILCYLCEWTKEGGYVTLPDCGERCPLKWPGGCCELKDAGLHEMWNNTDDLDLRISIAALISRLPEKD